MRSLELEFPLNDAGTMYSIYYAPYLPECEVRPNHEARGAVNGANDLGNRPCFEVRGARGIRSMARLS